MQSVNGLKQHTTNSGQKVLLPFGHLFSLDVLDVLPPYPYIILTCLPHWDTLKIFFNNFVQFSLLFVHFQELCFGVF